MASEDEELDGELSDEEQDDDETQDDSDETESEDDEDDDNEERQPQEPKVFIDFRRPGSRGPKTSEGNRGRRIMAGYVPESVVAWLKELDIDPESALCEPLEILVEKKLLLSTRKTKAETAKAMKAAEAQHQEDVKRLARELANKSGEVTEQEIRLRFLNQQVASEEAALRRIEREIADRRDQLASERARSDAEIERINTMLMGEREAARRERDALLDDRRILVSQLAEERAHLQTLALQERQAAEAARLQDRQAAENARKAIFETVDEARKHADAANKMTTALMDANLKAQGTLHEQKLKTVEEVGNLRHQLQDTIPASDTSNNTSNVNALKDVAETVGMTVIEVVKAFAPKAAGS